MSDQTTQGRATAARRRPTRSRTTSAAASSSSRARHAGWAATSPGASRWRGASVVASDVARANDDARRTRSRRRTTSTLTLAAIRETGGEATPSAPTCAARPRSRRSSRETVARYGRLDVLVNNAGVYTGGPVTELHRGGVGRGARREPEGAVPLRQARGAAHERPRRRRPDHHHLVDLGARRHPEPGQLPGVEARRRRADAHARPRARPARSHRQHRLPDRRPHADARLPDRDRAGVLPGGRAAVRRVDGLPGARCARSAATSARPCSGSPRTQPGT